MKKIKEVSEMAGISKRTLQYYDDGGLITTRRSAENYRLYDSEDLEQLWSLLVYKEIGFELEEIKILLDLPKHEKEKKLKKRIDVMRDEIHRLNKQIQFAETVKNLGIPPVPFTEHICKDMTYVGFITFLRNLFQKDADRSRPVGYDIKTLKAPLELSKDFLKWLEKCFKK